jgi:hypothetical protein
MDEPGLKSKLKIYLIQLSFTSKIFFFLVSQNSFARKGKVVQKKTFGKTSQRRW